MSAVARSSTGSHTWVAILELPGGFLGSLNNPSQLDPNITHITVACDMPNINAEGHAFPSALTIRAAIPYVGDGPELLETHLVTIKLFADGVNDVDDDEVMKPKLIGNNHVVPEYVANSADFMEGKTHFYEVPMKFKAKGVTCAGLFVPSKFNDWPATVALATLQHAFGFEQGFFTLWVRGDRSTPFPGPVNRLRDRLAMDRKESFYEKFYQRQPIAVIDEMAKRPKRPLVEYQTPSLPGSLNATEMLTKYAMGVYELYEFQEASATEFNNAVFEMKTLKMQEGSNLTYLALLKPTKEIALTPSEGDKLVIRFQSDGIPVSEQWSAKVLAPLKPYMSSYISLLLYRPRKAHPPGTVNWVRVHEILDFVETDVGSGELSAVNDEKSFAEIFKDLPAFEVKATITPSETTARRQILAIEAMQRGARYNIRKNVADDSYKPWTENEQVKAFRDWMLLRDSVPKAYTDWLGHGARFVEHFKDADQLDAIDNLFRKAPSPVGVLVGPAGTGKTVLMASMIKAHVKAYDSAHIVGTPSNVGADVAGKVIQSMFKADDSLKGKIIMRASNEGSDFPSRSAGGENDNSSLSRKSSSSNLNAADVGVYSADGWYDADALEGQKAVKDLLNVVRKVREIGNFDDPRMDVFNQSLSYHALCTVGFEGFPSNDYTKNYHGHGEGFRKLFQKVVQSGGEGTLDAEEKRRFRSVASKLYNFTIKKTTVLVGTLTYLAHKQYVESFQHASTFFTDEAGQASVADWLNIPARYSFKQAFLLGDPNQLYPVVVGPSPLTGFMRALEMSPIQLLIDAQWPSVTLTDNRRSASGIIDIPSKLFYKGVVKAHSNSGDFAKHKWTIPISDLVYKKFSVPDMKPAAVAYFSSASPSVIDPLSKSTYNVGNLAFCLNFVEHLVRDIGVTPEDIGYTSPYQAQCKKARAAMVKLEAKHGSRYMFTRVKIAPIDSYQGGSRKIMIGDYTSSEKLGFMSARGRNCVLLTRAEDFALYIGNKSIRAPRDEKTNFPGLAFAHGGHDRVARDLSLSHEWMKHEFAL